jgi:hypothetical protein
MAAVDAQEIYIQHDSSSVIPRSYDMIDAGSQGSQRDWYTLLADGDRGKYQ